MKKKIQLGVLAFLVALLVWANLPKASSPSPAGQAAAASGGRSSGKGNTNARIPDARLQVELLDATSEFKAEDIKRNIFEYGAYRAPTSSSPRKTTAASTTPVDAGPPPPPPPPPAPVRFFGFVEGSQGGHQRVFLTDGEKVFVAREGDLFLQQKYRLVRVDKKAVEVEETSGTNRWVIPLEQP